MSGTPSAMAPLMKARNSTLYYYQVPAEFPTVKCLTGNQDINELVMHPIARTVCRIALVFLCRISELLSLTVADVFPPDRVISPGSKRGQAYMMYFPALSTQLQSNSITDKSTPLFPITYHKCYLSYVKAGVRYHKPGAKNSARCHSGRYAVRDLVPKFDDMSILSDLLHHKSSSSLLYYINK